MASPPPLTVFRVPTAASEGFRDGTSYDAYRPSYPPEAVEALLVRLRIADRPHARVVELGAGTGKFTEAICRPHRHEGFEVVAVEPLESMRRQLEGKNLPGVKVVEGHAARIPVTDEWGDACIVAQAFHWFASDETLREISRVLKPRAVLGVIWNIEDYNKPLAWPATTRWEQKLSDLVWSLAEDGHPRFRHAAWQSVFTNQLKGNSPLRLLVGDDNQPLFSLPIGEHRIPFTVWLGKEALWRRINTLSQVAILKGKDREDARRTFDEALEGDDVERNEKGELAVHGVTYFAWSDRIGGNWPGT